MKEYSPDFKKKLLTYFIVFISIFFLDQFTKICMLHNIGLNNSSEFLSKILKLTVVQNTGGAFSIFKQYPIYFKIIGLANILIFSYLTFCPTVSFNNIIKIGCACVLGGTAGNLIDRFFRGGVIDFLDLQFVHFAVFNFADVFINIGVGLILIGWFLTKNK